MNSLRSLAVKLPRKQALIHSIKLVPLEVLALPAAPTCLAFKGNLPLLDTKRVTPSPSAQDLGLQVDSTLSYDEHVTQTVSLCIGSLCQINRVKHLFDARTLERVINALVFSKLYYCSPVWSNTSKKNISKLQKVQNFACRIITGKRKYDQITPALRELRWLPVTSFLKYTLGVLAFKWVKGLAPSYLCHRFKVTRPSFFFWGGGTILL